MSGDSYPKLTKAEPIYQIPTRAPREHAREASNIIMVTYQTRGDTNPKATNHIHQIIRMSKVRQAAVTA